VTRRGLVLFGLMSVIWGIPYLFIRVAVAEITPATLVLARTDRFRARDPRLDAGDAPVEGHRGIARDRRATQRG